jgi:hypothetical protein
MAFVTSADIVDKLLLNIVTPSDLAETQKYLIDFAASLGVDESDILVPTPFRFLQLGIAYASFIRCKFNMGKLVHDQALGITYDPYEVKMKIYQSEIASLKSSINADMLTTLPGDLSKADFSMTIDIYRS